MSAQKYNVEEEENPKKAIATPLELLAPRDAKLASIDVGVIPPIIEPQLSLKVMTNPKANKLSKRERKVRLTYDTHRSYYQYFNMGESLVELGENPMIEGEGMHSMIEHKILNYLARLYHHKNRS